MKIGVYVCHCGTNIAGVVNIDEVVEFAKTLPNVTVAKGYQFMCSEPGQDIIRQDIKELGLNRVVVASCSPLMHEPTFRRVLRDTGVNQYFFNMANIREHVSWVTEDHTKATEKAKALVRAAVFKAGLLESLETREVDINPDTLIIGAGVAGIQAALDIGDAGYKVYLVDKEPSIGGHMAKFDKTFPTLDCAACILTPKMVSVGRQENIKLFSYSEVASVSGSIGNFKVKIKKNPRYVDLVKCNACGDCIEVCPVKVPNEFDMELGKRKAIYRSFAQAVPNKFLIDKEETPPCEIHCPIHQRAGGYVNLVKLGKFKEAMEIIRLDNPLPLVCGRVCFHPCEKDCRRGTALDDPIAIKNLKRFAYDWCLKNNQLPQPPEITDKHSEKVAVIGSGPAGLACAHDLALEGYPVTIFESMAEAGGMLRLGIPEYRLPREILDNDIGYIKKLGVEIKCGQALGKDFSLDDLFVQEYKAIFLATGAHKGLTMGIPGESAPGSWDAIDYLRQVHLGKKLKLGKIVMVVGGGNTAIDAARVALRNGADQVMVYYRRTEKEMPADPEEIHQAGSEGIEFRYLTAPVEILTTNKKVSAVKCIKMKLGEPDASGRRRPIPVEGSEYEVACDSVIMAVSQSPDTSYLPKNAGFQLTKWDSITVDENNQATGVQGIFAGGDVVRGPATVVEAIADGKKAAIAIQKYLRGEPIEVNFDERMINPEKETDWRDYYSREPHIPRLAMPELSPKTRISSFDEVQMGFSEEEAIREAERCLGCGPCVGCQECVRICKPEAILLDQIEEEEEITVGNIIVSTGFNLMDPTRVKEYGYGHLPNVITSLEFERLSSTNGPTEGEIVLKNGQQPKTVAILHCIGSRDDNYHPYCSRICCMYALKIAHLVRERIEADVYQLYIDMRTPGKGYEEFYNRLLEEGVRFIRGRGAEVTDFAIYPEEQGKLIVRVEDTLSAVIRRIPVDMVILCPAVEPRLDVKETAKLVSISMDANGFYTEKHPKLAPVETTTAGVFLAGCCSGPKDIPDSVAQGSAAAAGVLSLISRGKVEIESATAFINEDLCSGCKICNDLCPYLAISYDETKKVSVVNEALCKGCGTCAAACPSGAIKAKNFTDQQVLAEIEGVML